MGRLKIIAGDFRGLCRVCGVRVGLRWLGAIAIHLGACLRSGNLQPADAAMGDGPFPVKLRNARASLVGEQVMTGLREIWVRDIYLGDFLSITPDAVVVDLGANMGIFSALALGQSSKVRVLAVEADPQHCLRFERLMTANGWNARAQLVNAFVGGCTSFQSELLASGRCAAVPTIDAAELLRRIGSKSVDLLKCDIEGSEFDLFAAAEPLIAATRQIALEIHPECGDADGLIDRLKRMGFEIRLDHRPPTIILRGRRPGVGVTPLPTVANPDP
jgi:FkbM family methyltransferase